MFIQEIKDKIIRYKRLKKIVKHAKREMNRQLLYDKRKALGKKM